jgi:hypothetical protein
MMSKAPCSNRPTMEIQGRHDNCYLRKLDPLCSHGPCRSLLPFFARVLFIAIIIIVIEMASSFCGCWLLTTIKR